MLERLRKHLLMWLNGPLVTPRTDQDLLPHLQSLHRRIEILENRLASFPQPGTPSEPSVTPEETHGSIPDAHLGAH